MKSSESKWDQARPSEINATKCDQVSPSQIKWDEVRPFQSPILLQVCIHLSWPYRYDGFLGWGTAEVSIFHLQLTICLNKLAIMQPEYLWDSPATCSLAPKDFTKPRQTIQSPKKTKQSLEIRDKTKHIKHESEISNKSSNTYQFIIWYSISNIKTTSYS